MNNKGQLCEQMALQFFEKQGWHLVSRNTRWAGVEIDLILKNKDRGYMLVEVKSYNSFRYFRPMSLAQKKRLKTAFTFFCEQHKEPVEVNLILVDTRNKKNTQVFVLDF